MKNQVSKFTSGDATLTVSIHKGKKDLIVQVRTSIPSGDKVKKEVPCRDYFDMNDKGEKEALAKFNARVKEATDQGWELKASSERGGPSGIVPVAPKKNGTKK